MSFRRYSINCLQFFFVNILWFLHSLFLVFVSFSIRFILVFFHFFAIVCRWCRCLLVGNNAHWRRRQWTKKTLELNTTQKTKVNLFFKKVAKNTYSSRPSVMIRYIDKYPINVSEEHRFHHFLLNIKTSAKELFQFSSVLKRKNSLLILFFWKKNLKFCFVCLFFSIFFYISVCNTIVYADAVYFSNYFL